MKKKMNNKGFSLVELIVVVLIMAIIGVALAPQVMKWVGNARISADVTSYDTLVDLAQLAYADEAVYDTCKGKTYTIKMTGGTSGKTTVTKAASDTDTDALDKFIDELTELNGDWEKIKAKSSTAGFDFTVTDGKVTKGTAPDADKIDK